MKYFYRNDFYRPKNCIWGPRLREGVVLSRDEWFRINRHDAKQKEEENVSERQKKVKQKSISRTSNLKNGRPTIESLEKNKRPKEREKQTNSVKDYNKILRKREKECKKLIAESLNKIHESRSATKELLSASTFSAVLTERCNQVNFDERLKAKAKDNFAREKIQVEASLAEAKKKNREERMKRELFKKKFKEDLDGQMEELKKRKKDEDAKTALESEQIKRRANELKLTLRRERENETLSRLKLKETIENYLKSEREIKDEREKEEKEEIIRNKIFKDVAAILADERRKRENVADSQSKIEGIQKFDRLRKILEREIIKERERIKAQKIEMDAAKRDRLLKIKIKMKEVLNKAKEDKKKEEEEARKQRAVEKMKKEEDSKERVRRHIADLLWKEKERRKEKDKKREILANYEKQWEENKEKKRLEREWEKFLPENVDKENAEVAKFCDYVLHRTLEKNRPLFPVLSAIKSVKLQYGITKPKINSEYLKSRIHVKDETL